MKRQIALLNLKAQKAKQLGSVSMGEGHVSGMIFAVSVSGQIVLPDKYESLTWVPAGSLANVPLSPDYLVDELKEMMVELQAVYLQGKIQQENHSLAQPLMKKC